MVSTFDNQEAEFDVIVNREGHYSIWQRHREIPPGWRKVGKSGKKTVCLAYIEEVWTNMRPLSAR